MTNDRDEDLPERSRVVRDALRAAGLDAAITALPASTRTAAEAAAALGCDLGAIANSLVFMTVDADGNRSPLLVMTSGAHRVDTAALAAKLGCTKVDRARPEEVRAATGQVIGGVAPAGHPAKLPTIIDTALAEHDQLWAAGGTPHTVFPLTYTELVTITAGREEQVGN